MNTTIQRDGASPRGSTKEPTISGFMVLRNAVAMGYPFVEAIVSSLPVCDEILISDGYSSDDTWAVLDALQRRYPAKIKLFQDSWTNDPDDGRVIADVSNRLRARCSGDYCLYVQGNEVLHERSRQEIRNLPILHPQVELFRLPFVTYMGATVRLHVELRRRLFVNHPRITVQGDAYDAGYRKVRLLASPRRFVGYLLHREGETPCHLAAPFFRYRGIFPECFLDKLAVRGTQYATRELEAAFRDELQHAEAALDAARHSGEGTEAYWLEMKRFHAKTMAQAPGRNRTTSERLESCLTHRDADHPAVMSGLLDQWRYDPWASLDRLDEANVTSS